MTRALPILLAMALLAGCGMSRATMRKVEATLAPDRSSAIECDAADACATPTPFGPLVADARASTTAQAPVHHVALLERGEDALALRVHLIRSARRTIDLQTFLMTGDDSGTALLHELLAAARRGVAVRVLVDQLFSLDDTPLLAQLARAHTGFEMRMYNPTFGEASTQPLEFAVGIACCFTSFNQRMHNKLLLVDEEIAITGGRNMDDRYFDWSAEYNYRDRDVLVVGPVVTEMRRSFDGYWGHKTAVPLAHLSDVGAQILADARTGKPAPARAVADPGRVAAVLERAGDAAWVEREFVARALRVGRVEYFADLPGKRKRQRAAEHELSLRISGLLGRARTRVMLQTPYLLLSAEALDLLQKAREASPGLRVVVSTNSLAATDAFYVYAITHKYKRRYLKRLQMEIHEYKPFPGRHDAARSGAPEKAGKKPRAKRRLPVPLTRPGVRRGLHAKSIVIDHQIALIGSHNFDPRSDGFNTESGLIVWDERFARAVEASIEIDVLPENAWTIARRKGAPVVGEVNSAIGGVSESLPVFDVWPFRYATSYELKPDCAPQSPFAPGFHDCYVAVGEFPEVALSFKDVYTRIIMAFGVGLTPIL
jgi:phosphatidylserine/phosphatidylglycerophosphate/cardiolipin synthase-like enzyme